VFLGGGIAPKILAVLEKSDFMATFTAKGRFEELLKKIAIRVILDEKAPQLGAAHCALKQQPAGSAHLLRR
jgi:glucokinase